uniref:Uncharacterized protein n=1 Tax=Nelumbo nucifera TaxID=4432 RepID=A0A822Y2N7_NELNU|nr:TPA_asm: hypothetical protein HUJ06_028338 [Nelumbo nucifera]
MDLDWQIEHLMERKPLPEAEVKALCEQAWTILIEEWNIQLVKCPITHCGDIHGQFFDFIELCAALSIASVEHSRGDGGGAQQQKYSSRGLVEEHSNRGGGARRGGGIGAQQQRFGGGDLEQDVGL